jgi:uncharacterized protein GlcG (DUF336 family)
LHHEEIPVAKKPLRPARRLTLERLEERNLLAGDAFRPFVGDFDGDGIDTPALYDIESQRFYLRDANTPGFPTATFQNPLLMNGLPVAGDFNGDGRDTVGLFSQVNNTFRLAHRNAPGTDFVRVAITNAPQYVLPLVGDWNGDGRDTPAVYDPHTHTFYIKDNLASGPADQVITFWPGVPAADEPTGLRNRTSWLPVAGDFDGSGRDSIGLYHRWSRQLYVQETVGADRFYHYSLDYPATSNAFIVAGDWDQSGDDSVGFWDAGSLMFDLRGWVTASKLEGQTYVAPSISVTPLSPGEPRTASEPFSNPPAVAAPLGKTQPVTQQAAPEGGMQAATFLAASLGTDASKNFITKQEVTQLLKRAAAASKSEDGIIAIVDRGGRVLGVRVERLVLQSYDSLYPNPVEWQRQLVFAIDGAVAKARTAASFANGDFHLADQLGTGVKGIAPLTSRTIRNLSQSTVTEREVDSNPNFRDPANFPNPLMSPIYGPGFVAPIGLGGHFPPDIANTPPVDLFHIEHQGRDSTIHPGWDGVRGTADDVLLPGRFNVPPGGGPLKEYQPPDSYGFTSGTFLRAQSRGFATLPGGIPLYKDLSAANGNKGDTLVGGIGVFFPGALGYATFEQGFVPQSMLPPGHQQTTLQRVNAPRVLEAEWIAYAAAGGSLGAAEMYKMPGLSVGALGGIPRVPGYDLPFGRIDLVGITLEVYGPNPTQHNPQPGVVTLLRTGQRLGQGNPGSGQDQRVAPDPNVKALDGKPLPFGWLVLPQPGEGLTVADVERIVRQGIEQANKTRAAIRLPIGTPTSMVLSVADRTGKVLGLFRMQDATVFSLDVAVAKARNTAYYADPTQLRAVDFVDDDLMRGDLLAAVRPLIRPNGPGIPDLYADIGSTRLFDTSQGVAFTNRTFRFLAQPRYPSGQDGTVPPAFSILTDPGINITNGELLRPNGRDVVNIPANWFRSVAGFAAFRPGRNFRSAAPIANQNGIVFFPGSTPLYKGGKVTGGFGVSGDGVDQDDVVTAAGQVGYAPPLELRADRVFYRGVRLPFQKFNRNPEG